MKDTYYFSHDYNCRTDDKIKNLLRKWGMLGYGIWWAIIEDLYNNNNMLRLDFEAIAYDLREKIEVVKSVILDFELFNIDTDSFSSESVNNRLNERNKKSVKASESANKRWSSEKRNKNELIHKSPQAYVLFCFSDDEEFIKIGITITSISRRFTLDKMPYEYEIIAQYFTYNALDVEIELNNLLKNFRYVPSRKFGGINECYSIDCIDILSSYKPQDIIISQCDYENFAMRRNAIKEKKGKKKKVKEMNKEKPNPPAGVSEFSFQGFWNLYDKKRGDKVKLERKWNALPLKDRESIMAYIPKYKQAQPAKQFRKDPQTFLNNRAWEDELIFTISLEPEHTERASFSITNP